MSRDLTAVSVLMLFVLGCSTGGKQEAATNIFAKE